MEKLTLQQMITAIRDRQPFSAMIDSGAFELCIRRLVPFVGTAIHDGHRVDEALALKMEVSEQQRQFEEDPFTGAIVEDMDISLTVFDSRYCYDLNRRPEACIYDEAWGRKVWLAPVLDVEREDLLARHAVYYRVLDELLGVLADMFGAAVLYDLHSYNFTRIDGSPPLFNIGTWFIDSGRFGEVVDHLRVELERIELPECEVRVALDEVFAGKGYQAEYIHRHYPEIVCIPLEVKKVFMDELSFALDENLFESLRIGVIGAIESNQRFFRQSMGLEPGKHDEGDQIRT